MRFKDFKYDIEDEDIENLPSVPKKQALATISSSSLLKVEPKPVENNPIKTDNRQVFITNNYQQEEQEKQKSYNQVFSNEQLASVEIPKPIKSEFREAYARAITFGSLGIISMLVSAFFLTLNLLPKQEMYGIVPASVKIPMFFSITIGIFGIGLFIYGLIRLITLRVNIKSYRSVLYNGETEVPKVLKDYYESLLKLTISINWIALWVYMLDAVVIGVLFLLANSGLITDKTIIKNCNYGKIICYSVAGFMALVECFTFFNGKYHCFKLQNYFNGKLITDDRETEVKKHTTKVCVWSSVITLMVLFFSLIAIWRLIRRQKVFALPNWLTNNN